MHLRCVSLAVLLLGASAARLTTSTSAASRANVWLRMHQDPDQQGLQDLKNSDPNAFAIVSALLMKQQAGLLDPANPTGKRPEAEHESAADIMRDAPTIEGAPMSAIAVRAPVQHAVFTHGNPWAFKKTTSDDDVMNIIGGGASEEPAAPAMPEPAVPAMPQPVSSLISSRRSTDVSSSYTQSSYTHGNPWAFKAGGDDAMSIINGGASAEPAAPAAPAMPPSSLISSRSALSQDMDLVGMAGSASDLGGAARTPQSQGNYYGISMDWGKKSEPVAPVASMSQQSSYVAPAAPAANRANPYLEGIDLGQSAPAAPKPAASMINQNSYLSQINFPAGRSAPASGIPASKADNELQSFSWDEYSGVASGKVQVRPAAVETQYLQRMEDKIDETKVKGALSDWLAPPKDARKPVVHEQQQEDEQPGEKIDPMAIDNYNSWAHSGAFQ